MAAVAAPTAPRSPIVPFRPPIVAFRGPLWEPRPHARVLHGKRVRTIGVALVALAPVIALVIAVPVGMVALFFLFGAVNTMLPASF